MSVSVVYELRNPMHEGSGGYPNMDDHHHHDATAELDRYTADPNDSVVNDLAQVAHFTAPQPHSPSPEFVDEKVFEVDATRHLAEVPEQDRIELPPIHAPLHSLSSPPSSHAVSMPLHKDDSPTATTPQRSKAIPKPQREETKNNEGKFVCTYLGCMEDVREFGRKCEWNKHMDKHDRPYKCAAEGCEKLPGFTYSGGLLRHEREVHGKHGGPKNSFYCPHINCKRHAGKGFSRQENLNEHLRRVHTQSGGGASNGTEPETDDAASDHAVTQLGIPQKRKREDDDMDIREEIKRVRSENEELRKQVHAQTQQTAMMIEQIAQLQAELSAQRVVVPETPIATAPMI
ncbi:cell wall transcription factor ACE2 [Podospora australis]|uniref:Cell wall transcription factor ACE2 n=1 Tax=Podospora australis TaxID=1536484 RepID=A0AAN7AN83_9PEZI|nr:cell wall transcription factor ACE2 [Podospora australis]